MHGTAKTPLLHRSSSRYIASVVSNWNCLHVEHVVLHNETTYLVSVVLYREMCLVRTSKGTQNRYYYQRYYQGWFMYIRYTQAQNEEYLYYPGVCTKPGTYYQGWFMYMRFTGTE